MTGIITSRKEINSLERIELNLIFFNTGPPYTVRKISRFNFSPKIASLGAIFSSYYTSKSVGGTEFSLFSIKHAE